MGENLTRGLALLRGYLAISLQSGAELMERYVALLRAKEFVEGPVWGLLSNQDQERRAIATMLMYAMSSRSFFPDPELGLGVHADEHLRLFAAIVDILEQDQVAETDVKDVDERLRAAGLDPGLELDDLEAFGNG